VVNLLAVAFRQLAQKRLELHVPLVALSLVGELVKHGELGKHCDTRRPLPEVPFALSKSRTGATAPALLAPWTSPEHRQVRRPPPDPEAY
jgi:hypothetical protein